MRRQILVDADGLLYIAGAVGEQAYYHAVFEKEDGELVEVIKPSAAEIAEVQSESGMELLDRELVVEPGELTHCLQVAKSKLNEIKRRYKGTMEVYLKGDGTNFRDDVATLAKYKGNRGARKPHYLPEIKQYIVDHWNGIEISGKEADDAIATRAYELSKPYVVCSPDKDLDQIPGLHWNYAKNVEYEVSEGEAEFFFWQQVLSGDAADNIKGCWKIGPGKAQERLLDWYVHRVSDQPTYIWSRIVHEYEQSQQLPGCPYAGLDPEMVAIENARLVWMQTEPRRLWTPPGAPKEYMEATLDD